MQPRLDRSSDAVSYAHGASAVALTSDTMGTALDRIAALHGDRDAVVSVHQGIRLTFGNLRVEAERIARGLIAIGLQHGDRVAVSSPNRIEWLVTQYGVGKAGGVLVHVNPTFKSDEVRRVLTHSGASVLIAAAPNVVPDPRPLALRHVICLAPELVPGCLTWEDLGACAAAAAPDVLEEREASVESGDAASILYTSGTTGQPKGAVLSHHSLLNCGRFIGERLRYSERDRVCLPVPLYHTFGHMLGGLAALTHGSAVVLPGTIFDAKACVESIEQEQCTAFYGVPSMFTAILCHPRFDPERVRSLRTGVMAGAPCPIELMREVMTRMHMPEVSICYGLSEGGTLFQSLPDDPVERRVSTVGAIHPHVECKVVDPVSGRIVPRGVAGELWARGYGVMTEYWNDEAATRAIMRPGAWLRTGDLAIMRDDGYLNIVGRLKEMIISAGRNIYPREIEDLLRLHPRIRDVAVVGLPDDVYGESPCAWIQLHDGQALTADEVRRFCRERIAPYKVPRRVRFTEGFPVTASGKIQKFRLREMSIEELSLSDRTETA